MSATMSDVPYPKDARERLGRYVVQRRGELGLTQRELAHATGLSVEALQALEAGSRTQRTVTRRAVERALEWEPGSFDLILAGREPIVLSVVRRTVIPREDDTALTVETGEPPTGIPATTSAEWLQLQRELEDVKAMLEELLARGNGV